MKFGHLLKTFEADAALPDTVCLNYKKLKKLIKKHQQAAPAPAAVEVPQAADAEAGRGAIPAAPQAAVQQAAATAVAQVADVSEGHAAGEVSSAAVAAVAGVPAAAQGAASADATATVAEEDREFVATLNTDLSRINAHFMEKEEEAVIRLRALEDRLAAASGGMSALEMEQLRNEMVDFHGELVLMLHWSLVNYAAVAKILKKHDKMTGSRLRAPVLASVLHQPFLSTESISQLVKEAERHVQELAQLCGTGSSDGTVPSACEGSADVGCGGDDGEAAGSSGSHVAIYKRTRAALHMVKEMQETASTPSTLMPPSAAAAAASDAAPDGKKQRTGQQSRGSQQQQALGPEQDSLSRDAVPSATS